MTSIPQHIVDHLRNDPKRQQLRELDEEYRETLIVLNRAEAGVAHARKLYDLNYHRRRRAILANGHDDQE